MKPWKPRLCEGVERESGEMPGLAKSLLKDLTAINQSTGRN